MGDSIVRDDERYAHLHRLIIFLFLLIRVSDEQCVMIMSVRKGKRLISRLLPFLPSPQAAAIVMAIARNLPALAKKDKQDQVTISGCNINTSHKNPGCSSEKFHRS